MEKQKSGIIVSLVLFENEKKEILESMVERDPGSDSNFYLFENEEAFVCKQI